MKTLKEKCAQFAKHGGNPTDHLFAFRSIDGLTAIDLCIDIEKGASHIRRWVLQKVDNGWVAERSTSGNGITGNTRLYELTVETFDGAPLYQEIADLQPSTPTGKPLRPEVMEATSRLRNIALAIREGAYLKADDDNQQKLATDILALVSELQRLAAGEDREIAQLLDCIEELLKSHNVETGCLSGPGCEMSKRAQALLAAHRPQEGM